MAHYILPAFHAHLLAAGYTHAYQPESFYDDGCAESGPHLAGGPAYHEYTSHEDYIIIGEDHEFVHCEVRDHEMEKYFAQQFEQHDH